VFVATVIVIGVFFGASAINGFLGFGCGIVGMTVLTLTHGVVHAASLVNLMGLLISGLMAWMMREHIQWRILVPILPTGIAGVAIGVFLLGSLDGAFMTRALGGVVIAIAGWNLWGQQTTRALGPAWGAAAGAASGVLSGAMNTGGPPMVAYLYGRPETPDQLKATLQVVFTIWSLCRVPIAASQGMMTQQVLIESAIGLPAVFVGLAVGTRLARRISAERFRTVSWIAFAGMGLVLLLK